MVINACGLSYTHNVARVDLPAGPIMGGDSVCLNATLTLSNIAAYGVWSVADPTIATINTSGVVTGIAAGSTKVYYYISNACGSFTDSQTVYVAQTPYCDSLAGWHLLMPLVVTVFPNPVSGIVHVSAPVPLNIEVSNMAGYIQQRRLHANEVDVNNLPTGVYLLRITDENGVLLKTERMVKIE
jgi:hypothetical protein